MNIGFPYRFDGRGRTAEADDERHVRDLIEQVLFTVAGERVNRPTFGCGLLQLVFQPNSGELASTVRFLVQGALQQWLGEVIRVEGVDVQSDEADLRVTVTYVTVRSRQRRTAEFVRRGSGS